MVMDPTGTTSNIPLRYLEHSPFTSFLIPGMVLLVCNGLFGLYAFLLLVFNGRFHGRVVMLQGIILTGWIVVQVIMLREINFLQLAFFLIGLILTALGSYLSRFK